MWWIISSSSFVVKWGTFYCFDIFFASSFFLAFIISPVFSQAWNSASVWSPLHIIWWSMRNLFERRFFPYLSHASYPLSSEIWTSRVLEFSDGICSKCEVGSNSLADFWPGQSFDPWNIKWTPLCQIIFFTVRDILILSIHWRVTLVFFCKKR